LSRWPSLCVKAGGAGDNSVMGSHLEQDDEVVPVFGSWPRIYAAVVVSALAVMGLIALFSSFHF